MDLAHEQWHALFGYNEGVFQPGRGLPPFRRASHPWRHAHLRPVCFQRRIFDSLQGIAHPDRRASRELISSRCVWPRLAANVTPRTPVCVPCQRAKAHCHVLLQPEHILVPANCFSHIYVDFVGPLSVSHGFTYLFTVMDCSSCWKEALSLTDISAATCAEALFHGWISCFVFPAGITSDRGLYFTFSLCAVVCQLLGVAHIQTTAYDPPNQ